MTKYSSRCADAAAAYRDGRRLSRARDGCCWQYQERDDARLRGMAEAGIDLAAYPAKTLDRYAGQRFDEQVLLCDGTTDT